MPFITAQIQPFLQVGVTQVVKIDNSAKSDFMVAFFVLKQINSLAFLLGQWISESCGMNKNIFGKPLDSYDFLFVLNVKSVEISPKYFLLESL